MTGTVRVGVPAAVAAGPGVQSWVTVTVQSVAATRLEVAVRLVGLEAWSGTLSRSVVLDPGGTAQVELPVTPTAGSPAGHYPVLASVTAVDGVTGQPSGAAVHAETLVVVGDVSPLSATLQPAEPRAVRRRRVTLVLSNRGATDLSVDVDATSHPDLTIEMRHRVVVPARGTARARGRITADRPHLTGANRRLGFVLRVQGRTTPLEVDGALLQLPALGRTARRLLALSVVLALWAGLAFVGLGHLSKHLTASDRNAVTATSPPSGAQANGAPLTNPVPSSPGNQAGGPGSAPGGTSPARVGAATRGRVGGTVTGSEPGGVTVTLVPQALVDEASARTSAPVDYVGATPRPPAGVAKIVGASLTVPGRPTVSTTQTTVTQADGSWSFGDLDAPGHYLLVFSKAGYGTRKYVVTTAAGQPVTLTVPLTAAGGAISGSVTAAAAAGGTVPPVQITVTDGITVATTSTVTTGPTAGWTLSGISTPGTYLVTAQAPGFGAQSQTVTLGASGSAPSLVFALSPTTASLRGRVESVTDPVGGATVTASNGTVTRTVTSMAGAPGDPLLGSFLIPALPTDGGPFVLTVSAPGQATSTQSVDLASTTDVGFVTLQPSTSRVCGIVTFAPPAAAGAAVDVAGLVLTGDSGTFKTTSSTEQSSFGLYGFTGVPAGTYVLTASSFQRSPQTRSVVLGAGQDLGCPAASPSRPTSTATDFALRPTATTPVGVPATSQVSGRVVDLSTGDPLAGAVSVSVFDQTLGSTSATTTGPAGYYTVPDVTLPVADGQGLTPGVHAVTVTADGYEPQVVAVSVGADTVATAPLVSLAPLSELSGKASFGNGAVPRAACVVAVPSSVATTPPDSTCPRPTDPGATQAPGGQVVVTDGTTVVSYSAAVAADGAYRLARLPHGTYQLFLGLPADDAAFEPPVPVTVSLAVGQTRVQDLRLDRLGRYLATLQQRDADGSLSPPTAPGGAPGAVVGQQVDVAVLRAGQATTPTTLGAECEDGTPLTPVATGEQFLTYVSCASSSLTLTGLQTGSYTVRVRLHGNGATLWSTQTVQPVVDNETATGAFTLTAEVGRLTGRVVLTGPDAAGDPVSLAVPGATVTLGTRQSYDPGSEPVAVRVTTDGAGCFAVVVVDDGSLCPLQGEAGDTQAAARTRAVVAVPALASNTVTYLVQGPSDRYGSFGSGGAVSLASPRDLAFPVAPAVPVTAGVGLLPATVPAASVTLPGDPPNGSDGAAASVVLTPAQQDVSLALDGSTVTWSQAGLPVGYARPGVYSISASAPDYTVTGFPVTAVVPVQVVPQDTPLSVVPRGSAAGTPLGTFTANGSVTVAVVDVASNAAVQGASVTLGGVLRTTGTSGTALFPGLTQTLDGFTLDVAARGYATAARVTGLAVRPGSRTVVVRLDQRLIVSGVLVGRNDPDKNPTLSTPLASVPVYAFLAPAGSTCPAGTPSAQTLALSTTLTTTTGAGTSGHPGFFELPVGDASGLRPPDGQGYCVAAATVPGYALVAPTGRTPPGGPTPPDTDSGLTTVSATGPFSGTGLVTADLSKRALAVDATFVVHDRYDTTVLVPNATIVVSTSPDPNATDKTVTSSTIRNTDTLSLQPGNYTVSITAPNYQASPVTTISIAPTPPPDPSSTSDGSTTPQVSVRLSLSKTGNTYVITAYLDRNGTSTGPTGTFTLLTQDGRSVVTDVTGAPLTVTVPAGSTDGTSDSGSATASVSPTAVTVTFNDVPSGTYRFSALVADAVDPRAPLPQVANVATVTPDPIAIRAETTRTDVTVTPTVSSAALLASLEVVVTGADASTSCPSAGSCVLPVTPTGTTTTVQLVSGSYRAVVMPRTSSGPYPVTQSFAFTVQPTAANTPGAMNVPLAVQDGKVTVTVPTTLTANPPSTTTVTLSSADGFTATSRTSVPSSPSPTGPPSSDGPAPPRAGTVDLYASPGSYTLTSGTPDQGPANTDYSYVGHTTTVTVADSATPQNVSLAVSQLGDLTVTATRDGRIVPLDSVTVTPSDTTTARLQAPVCDVAIDSETAYCRNVPPGTAALTGRTTDGQAFPPGTSVYVRPGAQTYTTVTLESQTLTTAVSRNGAPVATDANHDLVATLTTGTGEATTTVATFRVVQTEGNRAVDSYSGGTFSFGALSGSTPYTVTITDPDPPAGAPATMSVTQTTGTGSGTTATAPVVLTASASTVLAVTDMAAVSSVTLTSTRDAQVTQTVSAAESDATGTFAFTNLATGDYTVTVDDGGLNSVDPPSVTLAAGQNGTQASPTRVVVTSQGT